jgi:hypothetical protein
LRNKKPSKLEKNLIEIRFDTPIEFQINIFTSAFKKSEIENDINVSCRNISDNFNYNIPPEMAENDALDAGLVPNGLLSKVPANTIA